MRKFLNWLFNPEKAGQVSFLIVGFVIGMGAMSFYIGTMIDTGSLAEWFGAVGTIAAVAVSLYLASSKEKKYVDLHISSASLIYINNDPTAVGIEFVIYNAGNKPFAWAKTTINNFSNMGLKFSTEDGKNLSLIAPNEIVKFREIMYVSFDGIWDYKSNDEAFRKGIYPTVTVDGPEKNGITADILKISSRIKW
ncbi:hypothetical protein [Weissella cibaria]|uniref:hypothetical protein n=1 Tax=Weissella cibaria TaxID=137591 RepID=UPI003D36FB72